MLLFGGGWDIGAFEYTKPVSVMRSPPQFLQEDNGGRLLKNLNEINDFINSYSGEVLVAENYDISGRLIVQFSTKNNEFFDGILSRNNYSQSPGRLYIARIYNRNTHIMGQFMFAP
ncbi:hypothetical protein QA601_07835 [Chitinispirillales bacterium ANBcel5]|uniref:hypothetical protein n=1 Tax=Cellulosispirillum alkaliphilum TaxID=3039283 RepID=UPI002A588E60|nr:hypothetical protein [Chitinispirillales bacterium ANBcel5]